MATEVFSSSDVLVTEANILYAPTGTTLPDETSVAWKTFSGWAAGWVHLGYTAEASQMGLTYQTFDFFVEQATQPIIRRKTSEVLTLTISLAQFTGANLALVTGGTLTSTAAGASQKAYDKIIAGGDSNIPEYLVALEGYRPDSAGTKQPVRIFLHRCTITLNGNVQFAKAGGTVMPVTISAIADTTKAVGAQLFETHIVTAPASS
jgi:hypothetical protein